MRGAILRKQNMYYTYMDKIFDSLNNVQLNYNWLISGYECNHYVDAIPYNKEYVWISGEELSKIIFRNKIQFIWGVFSAFEKDIPIEKILEHPIPYADGNADLWTENVTIQHPLAEIEIVPWDSGLVIVKSKTNEIVEAFIKGFPLAEDLVEYIRSV